MVPMSRETVVPTAGEHLTNGWDSGVAVEDTLVRRAAHVQASWSVTLARATGRSWRQTDTWAGAFLAPHGLALLGHPPLMVRFPGAATPRLGGQVEVREVHTAEELALAEQVLVEGYPMPHLQPLTPGDLWPLSVLSDKTRIWLAYLDGEPVATAAAHLDAGATLVEYVAARTVARGRAPARP